MVGSRGSKLALTQAQQVLEALAQRVPDVSCRIEVIRTTGDAASRAPLSQIGGVGVFVKEIEDALASGRVDFAVHSAKDMPTKMDPRLCIAAYPEREDPRDVLVSRAGGLNALPRGANVGTGSLRRRAQLLAVRPDLRMSEIRGNIDTRLRKLDDGEYDAIVLAYAGLRRMGLDSRVSEVLPTDVCLPAVGQGALAVQCRADGDVAGVLRVMDHQETRRCVEAERVVLDRVGGGCNLPLGVFAQIVDGEVVIDAVLASTDGSVVVRERAEGDGSAERLADKLLASSVGGSFRGF